MADRLFDLPDVRGKLVYDAELAPYTWFRVGGPADCLFLPADMDDLADFLSRLEGRLPVTCLGVGSNTIVRDGGAEGLVVRLAGRPWGSIDPVGDLDLQVGAGALDLAVARAAAKVGISGLSFLSGIPGTMGGAVRTNAGCYGRELKDCLLTLEGVTHSGERVSYQGEIEDLGLPQIDFGYRHSSLPNDVIVTSLTLRGGAKADPAALEREISEHQARRAETQPIREKTGGSTFANPDPPGTPGGRSSWKLIDEAGCRGLRVGGAQVSEKHCNFLINRDSATAADIEALGELVRARVKDVAGVDLRWEIRRIGRLKKTESAPD